MLIKDKILGKKTNNDTETEHIETIFSIHSAKFLFLFDIMAISVN